MNDTIKKLSAMSRQELVEAIEEALVHVDNLEEHLALRIRDSSTSRERKDWRERKWAEIAAINAAQLLAIPEEETNE